VHTVTTDIQRFFIKMKQADKHLCGTVRQRTTRAFLTSSVHNCLLVCWQTQMVGSFGKHRSAFTGNRTIAASGTVAQFHEQCSTHTPPPPKIICAVLQYLGNLRDLATRHPDYSFLSEERNPAQKNPQHILVFGTFQGHSHSRTPRIAVSRWTFYLRHSS
jgi:hypothetical protein